MRLIFQLFVSMVLATLVACEKAEEHGLLSRVAVTGASATAGQGVKTPPKRGDLTAYPMNMTHVLEGMIQVPHDDVAYFGDMLFFRNPKGLGGGFVKEINDYQPSLLVAFDFLFWFGHGYLPKNEDERSFRMDRLEYALALLDSVQCPIIIGNFPDVSFATKTLLSERQVPSDDTRKALNERIMEWGNANTDVHVIDVCKLWADAIDNKPISICNHHWEQNTQKVLLQNDFLHPTLDGLIAACLLMTECIGENDLETDVKTIKRNASEEAREN